MSDRVQWHQLEIDEVLARLETAREGISEDEAQRRLERFGPNGLATGKRALPVVILLRQHQSPLIYILIAAGLVTWLLGKYIDSAVILAVVVLNSIVGFVQEYKAEQAMRALARMTAARARVLRDGEEREIEAREVVPGDVVFLESGVKVRADLRLMRVIELQADEAIFTGESLPVVKMTAPVADPDAPLGDRVNLAFMGTSIVRGRGVGLVVATGMQTAVGHISTAVRRVGEVKSPLQVRLDRFARLIAIVVIGVTVLVFALGLLTGESVADIFLTAVATAVATVPEGLPVTITVALAVGVWRMAQRKAIIRKLPAVETLGSCTTICSDKTGTLTKNEMTVTKIYAGGRIFAVSGTGYVPEGEIRLDGRPVRVSEQPALELALRIGMLCNESSVYRDEDGRYRVDGDPTEAALIVAAMKAGLDRERAEETYPLLDEIPFESERQYMATLHDHAGARVIFVKGAPERIVEMCKARYDVGHEAGEGSGEASYAARTTGIDLRAILEESYRLAAEGLRVLAMAYRQVGTETCTVDHRDVESGLVFAGLQGMIDPPRPEAITAVEDCKRAGIRVAMVTGDHKVTAEAIARQMKIISNGYAGVVGGRELESMDDEELFRTVEHVAVYARAAA